MQQDIKQNSPTIMIVDDIAINRKVLHKIIENIAIDINIIEAGNGVECFINAKKTSDLALILLDIQMPVMDGFEVAKLLQKNKITRNIPVIFVTAVHCSNENILKGYEVGAIDYITKPVQPEILKEKARQFVELWRLRHGLEQEISQRIALEEKNIFLANHDVLTGLPNRRTVFEELKKSISNVDRNGGEISILFIDLDGFKFVNDNYGHNSGDMVLKTIAQRFLHVVRKTDVVARFGGDEFIIIINNFDKKCDHLNVVEKILTVACEPVFIANEESISLSASIGISQYPKANATADELLDYADMAMYKAKESGKNKFYFFSKKMDKEVNERITIGKALKKAMIADKITVDFQPIVRTLSGVTVGVEALVRWRDDELGFVSPDVFIPIAESSALIYDLGNTVFEKSVQHISELQKKLGIVLTLAINASTLQFTNEDWLNLVRTAVDKHDLDPNDIEIEITERLLLDDSSKVNSQLQAFRDLGVKLSVDDFGTGYSSLSYLKRCPVNTVKIDRGFIMDIPNDKDDMVLVKTIIAMAHGLGLEVIAEGVETQEQWDFLRAEDCDFCQGYFFSRPLPAADLENWFLEHSKP